MPARSVPPLLGWAVGALAAAGALAGVGARDAEVGAALAAVGAALAEVGPEAACGVPLWQAASTPPAAPANRSASVSRRVSAAREPTGAGGVRGVVSNAVPSQTC